MYQDHFSTLKETLTSNKRNHFGIGPAKIITNDAEACFKIIQGLLKAPDQGNKKFPNL